MVVDVDALRRGSATSATQSASITEVQPTSSDAGKESDNYRLEYEELVKSWRAEYDIKRQKAEEERARWEAIRAADKEEFERTGQRPIRDSWEQVDDTPIVGPPHRTVDISSPPGPASPSPADVRDLVTGEPQGGKGTAILQVYIQLQLVTNNTHFLISF